ncbi:MAG: TIGR02587 family membrane protein, partial [Spirulinaceae cyanobacterium]
MSKSIRKKNSSQWSKEVDDFIRGASGGFLFGIPLLYTMEVWWIGSYIEPPRMLGLLAVTYVVVFLLNRVEGFRENSNQVIDAAMESVEALTIGIICTTFLLILLRRITLETSLDEALGKIILESIPFSLGVTLSRSFLQGDRSLSQQQKDSSGQSHQKAQKANHPNFYETLADISATLIGAIMIAFSIAPTDEIPLLAAASSPFWLIAIIVVSLLISFGIVFAAGLTDQRKRQQQRGIFQTPGGETLLSYLVSLLASGLMLWFFAQLSL